MFALGEPGTLEAALHAGGFRDVVVRAIQISRQYPSAADAMVSLRDTLPSVHALLARLDTTSQEAVWSSIEHAVRDFEGPDGLVVSGELLLGVGAA